MDPLRALRSTVEGTLTHHASLKEIRGLADLVIDRAGHIKDVSLKEAERNQLRITLNNLLIPKPKIHFVDDRTFEDYTEDQIPDDWFASSENDLKTPFRMFDVETQNMVSTVNLGLNDQYCVVSHSWKGSEIDHQYFADAKSLESLEDTIEGQESICQESLLHQTVPETSDLGKVIEKSKADITVLERKVASGLTHARPRHDGERPKDIETLLKWYVDAREAESGMNRWQKEVHNAATLRSSAERRAAYYRTVWDAMVDGLVPSNTNTYENIPSPDDPGSRQLDSAIDRLTASTSNHQALAEENFNAASKTWAETAPTAQFFDSNRALSYGTEALLAALQRIRSTRKIEQSIIHAKKIFEAHFPRGGKRYVWLDTCCINKRDSYEMTESLALMGDWYANAEFCLVHLDTPRSEASWIDEWKHWKMPSYVPIELNIERFTDIGTGGRDGVGNVKAQVEWATRGWTLQELVLSKMTYFVNSHWQNLERPIEVIGPFYFLRPFIHRYLKQPFVRSLRKLPAEVIHKLEKQLLSNFEQEMPRERQLVLVLEKIGFVPPKNARDTTAEAQIGKAVLGAARMSPSILDELTLNTLINPGSECLDLHGRIALVNHLLADLVSITDAEIVNDRQRISEFSKIGHLNNWISGTGLLDSSASSVLITASERQTTVPTDKAYSLMGILGVRFPAFSAEGLPKALSRLLDEVVITYNDVSVFNWTGKHCGSPLQGRSLYPASIDAFVDPPDDPKSTTQVNASQNILKLLRARRARRGRIARDVNNLLAAILALAKELPAECSTLYELKDLADTIKTANFERLEAKFQDLKDIVVAIQAILSRQVPIEAERDIPGKISGRFGSFERIDEIRKSHHLVGPKLLLRRHKATLRPSQGGQQYQASYSKNGEAGDQEFDIQAINASIQHIIGELNSPLPTQVEEINDNHLPGGDAQNQRGQERRLVCPNPIVVSTSGIRGIFDIQRIIVTMIEPDKLRSRIRNAVPGQKIEGWCTISTGLSLTLVAFTCDAHVLAKQLDLMEVIAHDIDSDKNHGPVTDPEESCGSTEWSKSAEQRKVSRMVSFVQASDLQSIAGEWVLARFSGSPGARWFLCQLELGAGNGFYGQRIATDTFGFENAAPEQGLTEYWHQFTEEKKARTCETLNMYILRKALWRQAGSEMEKLQRIEDAKKRSKGHIDWDTAAAIAQDLSLNKIINMGRMTRLGVAGIGVELWANYLESRIERVALDRLPVPLQAAVRDLDHNKMLLPAMFHAGHEVHMF